MTKKDLKLFDVDGLKDQNQSWEEEWIGMPSYNNEKQKEPYITATFKFRNQEDFEFFKNFLQKNLYDGQKVFDGMQRKDKKSTWFPLKEKPSNYRVV